MLLNLFNFKSKDKINVNFKDMACGCFLILFQVNLTYYHIKLHNQMLWLSFKVKD
jgi:hypothetical protein